MKRNTIISPLKLHLYSNILFYIIPGIMSLFFFRGVYLEYTFNLLIIIIISSFFYSIGYLSIYILPKRQHVITNLNLNILYLFFFFYCIILIIIYSQNSPALFHVFSGDYRLINELRATATKNKQGFDAIINAIYFTLSYVILPSILLVQYYMKSKYRHVWFFILSLILMLNMQKARMLYLILPLVFLLLQYIPKKIIYRYIFLFFLFLIITSYISGFNAENFTLSLPIDIFERSTTGARFLFEDFNVINFVINRIFWIPFITAIDWLHFFTTCLGYTLDGSTAPVFYKLFGHESRFLIENEVFKFEFNSGEGSLGTANSHFALDAYLNFGYTGVAIYSIIAGLFTSIIYTRLPIPINFISYNYAFVLTFSSLHANFLGGGIWFILILIIFFLLLKLIFKVKRSYP